MNFNRTVKSEEFSTFHRCLDYFLHDISEEEFKTIHYNEDEWFVVLEKYSGQDLMNRPPVGDEKTRYHAGKYYYLLIAHMKENVHIGMIYDKGISKTFIINKLIDDLRKAASGSYKIIDMR